MTEGEFRHPTKVITVRLRDDQPPQVFRNQDVAFIPVTRFNLRIHVKGRSDHLGGRHLAESTDYDEYWQHRIDIFERVCVPSVLNLSPRPDAWYIAFDDQVPDYVTALLERLSVHPWIIPYFLNRRDAWNREPLVTLLTDHLEALGKRFLCSTRFDSDDSLHQQFYGALDSAIAQLRERGLPDETRCLNLTYGLVEAAGSLVVYLRQHMFESIFEPVELLQGPYRGSHDRITEQMPLVEILTNAPMWMYHRHERNLDAPFSRFRHQLDVTNTAGLFDDFGLSPIQGSALISDPESNRESTIPAVGTAGPAMDVPATVALRHRAHWSMSDRTRAIEMAFGAASDDLGNWLRLAFGESLHDPVDTGLVLLTLETMNTPPFNGPMYARLAGQLVEQNEIVQALRVFDYAVALMPGDSHIRSLRDQVVSTLLFELDFEEQFALSGLLPADDRIAKRLVFVASESLPFSGTVDACMLHDRAMDARRRGFEVYVITLLPHPWDVTTVVFPIREIIDGIHYERLTPPSQMPEQPDELRRANLTRVAERVASLRPATLVSDGTHPGGVVAAAIGRAFGMDVSFDVGDFPLLLRATTYRLFAGQSLRHWFGGAAQLLPRAPRRSCRRERSRIDRFT